MLPDAREHAGAVRAHRRRNALEERRGAQGLAGRDQCARRAHPLELGTERRDLAGAERDAFEPCEGELEVRPVAARRADAGEAPVTSAKAAVAGFDAVLINLLLSVLFASHHVEGS